jgi:hypothetical protein
MKFKSVLLLLFLLLGSLSYAQEKRHIVSGYVKDKKNGESLVGAVVSKKGTTQAVSTNEYGFYSLSLSEGEHVLMVSIIGYQTFTLAITLDKNISKTFELNEESQLLEEVVVMGEAEDKNIKSVEMSVAKLDIKQINKVPALLGEVDIIRAIQLLPGVTTMGEGATGFNVRGGNIDQNLILMDEAPVFNSSHLFGFFSVFNPDAVKDVKLIKGGIPAQYGGRVSSILDIRMKEGNSKQTSLTGGIGTIFSRFSVEAPIVKDKASFIIAGRRSYLDALVKPFLKSTSPLKQADFNFYDLTAKVNWRINERNTVFASGYFGRDVFGFPGFKFNWGNSTATTRWNHVFSSKLFMNLTYFYSNYDYLLDFDQTSIDQRFTWKSNIINNSLKTDFAYYPNSKNTVRFGAQALYYNFLPYNATGVIENTSIQYLSERRRGIEYSAYISNEHKLLPRLTAEYGLRLSVYTFIGKGTAYTFGDTLPNEELPLEGSTVYGPGEIIKAYINPEPRLALNYVLNQYSAIKASYNRMSQYLQLISNTAASTPLDVYTIATNNLTPLIADQGSVGYFRNFLNNSIETSVEVYYKYTQNQLDYIDNANLFINPTVENQLLQGLGRAYGAEFFIKKNKGKLNGWISYTLSKAERRVEGISNDNWFNSRYDRTHVLNIVSNYDFNKRWSVSGNFTFLTGTPATFPTSKLQIQNWNLPHNTTGERNNYRITPYHRLDFGATYNFKKNDVKRFKQSIVLSVYNVYLRKNAYSIYFQTKAGTQFQNEAMRLSIVGTIIPAITYNFNF